jgi:uncharacterized membrane protein SpoIIM required for sporulation
MNQDAFVEERKGRWEALTSLLKRARGGGIRSFAAEEVRLLGSLYRKTGSDLSYARARGYDRELLKYLNQLARSAYGIIYLREKDARGSLLRFFLQDYPALFRENARYILAAFVLFFLSGLAGFAGGIADPGFARWVAPAQFLEMWDRSEKDTAGADREVGSSAAFPMMSSWYLVNNFKVGLTSFAGGILLGLGTFYLIAYNGLIFGAIMALVVKSNHHAAFLSFVFPHSFIELLAIFICGGAGFMIARAIVLPGDLPVRDALGRYGRKAALLAVGTAPLFLLAGIIEASYSRVKVPFAFKAAFGLATVILLYRYFLGDPARAKGKFMLDEGAVQDGVAS